MKVVFVSNFFNHHQKPFSDAMYSLIGDDYCFIESSKISEGRIKMGWAQDVNEPYTKKSYQDAISKYECQKLIDNADVVIIGSAPYNFLENRLKAGKLTFIYSERLYKNKVPFYKIAKHFLNHVKKYIRFKNIYALCASAYTAVDFAKSFTFINKTYKWGYFPEVKKYENIEKLIAEKEENSILWCGRIIDWKHPEAALKVAKRLKQEGYTFKLRVIGVGALEEPLKRAIEKEKLSDCVEMLGAMKPEEVRQYMEKSEIYLFTSDRNEGWGAVLNESMNSACAVIASHAIGSAPFLLKDKENGFIYKDGDVEDLYTKTKWLIDNKEKRKEMAKNAYFTMVDEWNAENAAKKFVELAEAIMKGEKRPNIFKEGVCSKAELNTEGWYK